MDFQPIIKWTGSKRIQSNEIIQYFPEYIDTYYEPFCGGCSMMYRLAHSDIFVDKFVCSDTNGDLIDLWNTIKHDPRGLYNEYMRMWGEMCDISNRQDKRKYFEDVRDEFNQTRSPYLFFFIMRTCTNGMPRYNKYCDFNGSFHLTRDGINPIRLKPVLFEWSACLNDKDVEFRRCDYTKIFDSVESGDFLYLDPPYENTRSSRYFGTIKYDSFFDQLLVLNGNDIKFALSYDGDDVPIGCFENHINLKSLNSSFRKTVEKKDNKLVYESLYIN